MSKLKVEVKENGKNKAVLLKSQDGDWEGLFINGKLYDEGHKLGEGDYVRFWLGISQKFNIGPKDIIISEANNFDDEELQEVGGFPDLLCELTGNYEGSRTRLKSG